MVDLSKPMSTRMFMAMHSWNSIGKGLGKESVKVPLERLFASASRFVPVLFLNLGTLRA